VVKGTIDPIAKNKGGIYKVPKHWGGELVRLQMIVFK
jgi:hypothetical protein